MTESPIRLLLAFDDRVRRDQEHSPVFLHRRDRKFALTCEQARLTPGPQQWLDHLDRVNDRPPDASDHSLVRWRQLTLGFIAGGAVLGVLAMLGLLFYEGGQRINVTVILGFVLLQALLAAFTTIQSLAGWQPWRPVLARVAGRAQPGVIERLHPQLMARAAHCGGVAFGLTGLITLMVLVVIQDLAFGWSTTLNTGSGPFLTLVKTLATPWQWLWPAAVPDTALVETTRFFRAQPTGSLASPARLGDWWPFVAMVWITYVVLPRLLLACFSQLHLRVRARRLLRQHPGMTALQYRMETPTLDTGNGHNDAEHQPDTTTRSQLCPLPESDTVICWAGAGAPELPDALKGPETLILRAGGRASLAEDNTTLTTVAEHLAHITRPAVIVVTRSWEPPTGELQDFLEQAREQWPAASRVAVVPLAESANDEPPVHQLQQWLRFAERLANGYVCISQPPLGFSPRYEGEYDPHG